MNFHYPTILKAPKVLQTLLLTFDEEFDNLNNTLTNSPFVNSETKSNNPYLRVLEKTEHLELKNIT